MACFGLADDKQACKGLGEADHALQLAHGDTVRRFVDAFINKGEKDEEEERGKAAAHVDARAEGRILQGTRSYPRRRSGGVCGTRAPSSVQPQR